ncbi:hypothetical protein [Dysgonomonas sp. 520]|uniref:hypothetical protein n=1 Tax=Dysgonomonas sp. 520 TaxID=2302931 RepID=UPI0013D1F268|nr:hypothetical protein [Dysgonomonas sp. 520]NDW09029.1 hypothetical protein [Dysgonomonas sp. 520]
MKILKVISIIFILTIPATCSAQLFGLAGQYADGAKGQFVASFAIPTIHPKNPLNSYISSGLEYTTSGGAKMSGLNVKPIQISTFFTEDFFNKTPYTLLLNLDGGYLFDFRSDHKNGVVITPNIYLNYKFFYVKTGVDFDVTNGDNQFFVRAGVCLGSGLLKSFVKTKIW